MRYPTITLEQLGPADPWVSWDELAVGDTFVTRAGSAGIKNEPEAHGIGFVLDNTQASTWNEGDGASKVYRKTGRIVRDGARLSVERDPTPPTVPVSEVQPKTVVLFGGKPCLVLAEQDAYTTRVLVLNNMSHLRIFNDTRVTPIARLVVAEP